MIVNDLEKQIFRMSTTRTGLTDEQGGALVFTGFVVSPAGTPLW
ncbi:MAG: hypothetical protein AB7G88_07665 [Thermomicrobiales bacterium]